MIQGPDKHSIRTATRKRYTKESSSSFLILGTSTTFTFQYHERLFWGKNTLEVYKFPVLKFHGVDSKRFQHSNISNNPLIYPSPIWQSSELEFNCNGVKFRCEYHISSASPVSILTSSVCAPAGMYE